MPPCNSQGPAALEGTRRIEPGPGSTHGPSWAPPRRRATAPGLMSYVTCPILHYHPAVVAQKASTMQSSRTGVSASAWARARTSTSTSPASAGRRSASATRCSPRRSRSLRDCFAASTQLPLQALRRRVGAPLRRARRAPADRHRGVRPAVVLAGRPRGRDHGRHRAQARAGREVRGGRRPRQAEGRSDRARAGRRRRGRDRRRPRSAGSGWAGRSTPTCRDHPSSRRRPNSFARGRGRPAALRADVD